MMLILLLLPIKRLRIRTSSGRWSDSMGSWLLLAALAALSIPASAAAQWSADPRLQQALRTPTPYVAFRVPTVPTSVATPTEHEGCVSCNGIRLQDEIVLVNTRPLGCTTNPDRMAAGLRLKSYDVVDDAGHRRWKPYNLEALESADPSVTTVIFVHGNQIAPGEDCQEGLAMYRCLVRRHCGDEPIRFVIYSWPATKTTGPLQDVREKAARTQPLGWEFAWFLDQLPGETPVGLIGFSFGARIITGGLHVLGGGELCGHGLEERVHPYRAPVRVVLIAAALHSNWLGPNQFHGQAMSQVDQMLLLNNSEDLAMRYYHFTTTHGRPQALGLCGPTYLAPEDRGKICNRNLCNSVGSHHDLMNYLCAPGVCSQTWSVVTFAEFGCRPSH